MTLKIIKPKQPEAQPEFDEDAARAALISGMVSDAVYDKHTAVEATGAKNWGQIASIYNELEGELKMLSEKADEYASYGVTSAQIVAGVNAIATNFDANDIKTMKTERYGTVTAWKNTMKV
ncbi:MAG: hypothetical protein KAJ03_01385 [Gammaproteobacteria bacterium]|nr:hypothetical protein [Gammaproteobacteria bacterium]